MRLYLCRHAHAAPGDPDDLRELTEQGRIEARHLADILADQQPPPEIVLTSPLVRARQTAEAIAEALGADSRVDARLAPGATASSLLAAVGDIDADAAALVGHQPDCSEIAVVLAGRDPGFPPGGMLALDVEP